MREMVGGLLIRSAIHVERTGLQVQLGRAGILTQLLDELIDVVVGARRRKLIGEKIAEIGYQPAAQHLEYVTHWLLS